MTLLPENLGGMLASSRYPMVYLNVPKCACTTIKKIMYYLDYGKYFENPLAIHREIQKGRCLINKRQSNLLIEKIKKRRLVFTFVRDPLERAYSCFNEKILYQHEYSFPRVSNYLTVKYGMTLPETDGENRKKPDIEIHRDNFIRFLTFIEDNIAGKTQIRKDPHWLPQKLVINTCSNILFPDFIGRVRNFNHGMSYIFNVLGIDDCEPIGKRFNEGPPPPYSLDEIYDSQLESMAHRVFEIDYMAFGEFSNGR